MRLIKINNKLKNNIGRTMAMTLILSSVAIFTSGCLGGGQDSTKVLNVYNVGDYIDESLISEFEEQTGIDVQYSTYDTNEMMYQKVKSGSTKYDLVFPSDYMVQKMSREGLLKKINYNNIPNFKYIDKSFLNPKYDPTNEYSVPYMWGTLGIVYNKNMVDDKVDSWDILWDKKYTRNILMFDSVRDSMGVALKKLGYSMNSVDKDQINAAKDLLIKQKPLVLAYVND
ncbi:MAG: spermidine/putrescine ABC transporter substrate-binding protein, partial [Peptostreptococcus sp.]|nr:spermidine/putrescine ABC transporter substrate-binding protein [Peptostreptococcus sp.]